jgi:hypothetical protein
MPDDAPDLTPHPVIAKMLAHPEKPTKAVVLLGYLGPSEKAGFVRLYPDLDLRHYHEIPTNGIIHSEPIAKSDTLSPTRLVVCAHSMVEPVHSVPASFLQGSITAAYPTSTQPSPVLPPIPVTIGTPGHPCTRNCDPPFAGMATAAAPFPATLSTVGLACTRNCDPP